MKVISESKNVKQTARRRPQASKTLMRHAVKQPGPTRQLSHRPSAEVVPKPSVSHIEPSRLLHARSIKKSRSISRFSSSVFDYQAMPSVSLPGSRPKPPVRSLATTTVQRPTTALLERAIQQADSHKQKPHRPARRLTRYLTKLSPRHAS